MKTIESMLDQGLIGKNENGKYTIYKITEKGRNVLRYFNKAMELNEIK